MKLQLLLPFLCFSLMACGQFGPTAKNKGVDVNILGASAGGGCVALSAPSGVSASGMLQGFSACPSANPNSVVIRYNLNQSGVSYCVFPGSGGSSFNSMEGQCFQASTPAGAITVPFSNSSFNTVAVVQSQNQSGFQTVGFGGIEVPYVVGKFR